jgi:hypothetical protein
LSGQLRTDALLFVFKEDEGIGPGGAGLPKLPEPLLQLILRVAGIAEPHVAKIGRRQDGRSAFLCIRNTQGGIGAAEQFVDVV